MAAAVFRTARIPKAELFVFLREDGLSAAESGAPLGAVSK